MISMVKAPLPASPQVDYLTLSKASLFGIGFRVTRLHSPAVGARSFTGGFGVNTRALSFRLLAAQDARGPQRVPATHKKPHQWAFGPSHASQVASGAGVLPMPNADWASQIAKYHAVSSEPVSSGPQTRAQSSSGCCAMV